MPKGVYRHAKGINHSRWKGDNVRYRALHAWVTRELGRPSKCEDCGAKTLKNFEWANISGNYLRDLKDWKSLCRKCHRAFDFGRIARGEKIFSHKLTKKDVIQIRKLYKPRIYSTRNLAREFNVSQKTIWNLINSRTWAHIQTRNYMR